MAQRKRSARSRGSSKAKGSSDGALRREFSVLGKEMGCILLASLSLFLFCAIFSFSPLLKALDAIGMPLLLSLRSKLTTSIPVDQNLMGPAGDWIGGVLGNLFGVASFMLPVLLMIAACKLWLKEEGASASGSLLAEGVRKSVLFLGLFGSLSGLAAIHLSSELGGVVGAGIAELLPQAFGKLGATLIIGTVLLLLLRFLSKVSLRELLVGLSSASWNAVSLVASLVIWIGAQLWSLLPTVI